MKPKSKKMRKPAPVAKKTRPASQTLGSALLKSLASGAVYVGSVQHKDTPSFAGAPKPRGGAKHVGSADESPDCMLCPTRWAWQKDAATNLLQLAIERGQFHDDGSPGLPRYVWARDPVDSRIIYEARRLSTPATGYKAYPLTTAQAAIFDLKL